jgi:hypothetical protein
MAQDSKPGILAEVRQSGAVYAGNQVRRLGAPIHHQWQVPQVLRISIKHPFPVNLRVIKGFRHLESDRVAYVLEWREQGNRLARATRSRVCSCLRSCSEASKALIASMIQCW